MDPEPPQVFEFGEFLLDVSRRLLLLRGERVPLAPKAFDTLLYFVEHRGAVLSRDELVAAVWPDVVVEENNLAQAISKLRQVLGEAPGENRYIVTVPGRGYRFVAEVTLRRVDAEAVDEAAATALPPSSQVSNPECCRAPQGWPRAAVRTAETARGNCDSACSVRSLSGGTCRLVLP